MELPAANPTNNPGINNPKNSKLILVVVVSLLTIIIIGGGVYFLLFRKGAKTASNTPTKQASPSAGQNNQGNVDLGYVAAKEGLNLRDKPATDGTIILLLPYGTELKIAGSDGDWYLVEAQTKGFVAKEFITKTKPTIAIKTFNDKLSPINFLYHDVYRVSFTKTETAYEYSFTSSDSYGGFHIETQPGLQTLGNYALQHYPTAKRSACDVTFGSGRKECEKLDSDTGTMYLVLVNSTLYKISYLKTEGGLLADLKNIVFYSFYFK